MSDVKHLIKLYSKYKKIKGYKDGGEIEKPHDKNNLKSLKDSFDKFMKEEGTENYNDGGEVQDSDESEISKVLKKWFKTPEPPAPKKDTQDDINEKIRERNRTNASGKTSSLDQPIYNQGGKVGYSDGEEVESDSSLSPEEFDKHIQALRDQGYLVHDVNGDEQKITVSARKPASEQQLIDENPDDKALENDYQNEDFIANEKADENSPKEELAKDEENASEIPERDVASNSTNAAQETKPEENLKDEEESDEEPKEMESSPKPVESSSDLKDAQRERDLNNASAQIQRGAAIAGSGLAHANVNPSLTLNTIEENAKLAGMPVQKYNELVADKQNDPNSEVSSVVRGYLKAKGMQISDKASAADLFKVAPFLQKDQALQMAMQKTLASLAVKQSEGEKSRKSKELIAADKLKVEKEKADAMMGQKNDSNKDKALTQAQTLLESARGNPAAAQAEKDLYSTQKANSLINMYGDPNKLSPQQVSLLVSEVAKIATGGVPTGHEQAALQPGTAESKLASLWSKLSNEPSPANAGAFIKQFKNYNDALAKDAQKIIKEKYGRVIESRKKQLGEENYNALQDQYLNRFQPQGTNSQDQKALQHFQIMPPGPDKDALGQILKNKGLL